MAFAQLVGSLIFLALLLLRAGLVDSRAAGTEPGAQARCGLAEFAGKVLAPRQVGSWDLTRCERSGVSGAQIEVLAVTGIWLRLGGLRWRAALAGTSRAFQIWPSHAEGP